MLIYSERQQPEDPKREGIALQALGFAKQLVVDHGAAHRAALLVLEKAEAAAGESWDQARRLEQAEERVRETGLLLRNSQAKVAWEEKGNWNEVIDTGGGRGRPRPWLEMPSVWAAFFREVKPPTPNEQ